MQTGVAAKTLTIAVIALVYITLSALPAMAQRERVVDPNWTTPRTADGRPDLQGIWGNKTITPIELADGETRAFLPDEEMSGLNQQRAETMAATGETTPMRYRDSA